MTGRSSYRNSATPGPPSSQANSGAIGRGAVDSVMVAASSWPAASSGSRKQTSPRAGPPASGSRGASDGPVSCAGRVAPAAVRSVAETHLPAGSSTGTRMGTRLRPCAPAAILTGMACSSARSRVDSPPVPTTARASRPHSPMIRPNGRRRYQGWPSRCTVCHTVRCIVSLLTPCGGCQPRNRPPKKTVTHPCGERAARPFRLATAAGKLPPPGAILNEPEPQPPSAAPSPPGQPGASGPFPGDRASVENHSPRCYS